MPDETEVIDGQETTEESVVTEEVESEETAEESSVEEEPEETPEEKPEEEPAEESEEAESEEDDLGFEEWAKQFGELPGEIKSEEDLIESYQSMLPEMKRAQTDAARMDQVEAALKARGLNGVEGLLSGELPPQAPAQPESVRLEKTYFSQSPAVTLVEQMKTDGRLREDPENPGAMQTYNAMAQFVDNAMAPELKKFESVYEEMADRMIAMQSRVRDLLWGAVPFKMRKDVERKDIDALIDKGLFGDYSEAIAFHSYNHPSAIRKVTEKAENRGAQKERKKLRRGRAIRKGKGAGEATTSWDYGNYLGSDGEFDNKKLDKMPEGQADKMLADWLKANPK